MNTPLFQKGDFVTNPRVSSWGIGEVLEIRDASNLLVYFQEVGTKVMPIANLCRSIAPRGGFFAPSAVQANHLKSAFHLPPSSARRSFRSDPLVAQKIISSLVRSQQSLELLLTQLLTSVDIADSLSPAWSITLFEKGFRLNVGPVEALVFMKQILTVNLVGIAGEPPFVSSAICQKQYKSLPQPQCAYHGILEDYAALVDTLAPAHVEFIKLASTKASGQPCERAKWRNSHSEGLILYARMVLKARA